jgi:hypothetical protein
MHVSFTSPPLEEIAASFLGDLQRHKFANGPHIARLIGEITPATKGVRAWVEAVGTKQALITLQEVFHEAQTAPHADKAALREGYRQLRRAALSTLPKPL